MTLRKRAAVTVLLLAAFGAAAHEGEDVKPGAGVKRVRLHVAGIV